VEAAMGIAKQMLCRLDQLVPGKTKAKKEKAFGAGRTKATSKPAHASISKQRSMAQIVRLMSYDSASRKAAAHAGAAGAAGGGRANKNPRNHKK
jgi:hypothetical protein